MISNVREIWAADADRKLIAPLLSQFRNAITVGGSKSLAYSSQLDQISPSAVYDKIDYKDRVDMTGEELYNETKDQIAGGFKGGQQYWKWQITLMLKYGATLYPEVEG